MRGWRVETSNDSRNWNIGSSVCLDPDRANDDEETESESRTVAPVLSLRNGEI